MRGPGLLALVALPAIAFPQSLGDAARQEAERRKKAQEERPGSASVIDDHALDKAGEQRLKYATTDDSSPALAPGAAASNKSRQIDTQPAAKSGPAPAPSSDLDRERDQRARAEQAWRQRFATANERIDKARARYDAVKDWTLAPGESFVDTKGRIVVHSPEHLRRLVLDAKAELDAAQKALDDLQESARRAGVPAGWTR